MPIYEYQCAKCQHHLEALQKLSDKPLRECPECGKHSLKRLVSAPMFRLAGSGWYETDFKSDKEGRRNLAGKDEAPAAEAPADKADKAEKKTEAKPAATTESGTTAPSAAVKTSAARSAAKPARGRPTTARPAAKKTAKKAARKR
jgi:putative FmdB family regulatory protein